MHGVIPVEIPYKTVHFNYTHKFAETSGKNFNVRSNACRSLNFGFRKYPMTPLEKLQKSYAIICRFCIG